MKYDVTTRKGHNGWMAESAAKLATTPKGDRMLELTTSKNKSGLAATASVCIYKKSERGYFTKQTILFQDFYKHSIAATPCNRVTEKAVREVHLKALLDMDDLIEEAKTHYANTQNAPA